MPSTNTLIFPASALTRNESAAISASNRYNPASVVTTCSIPPPARVPVGSEVIWPTWNSAAKVEPVPETSNEVILGKGPMPRLPSVVTKRVQPLKSPVVKLPFWIRFACRGDNRAISARKTADILSIISFRLPVMVICRSTLSRRAAPFDLSSVPDVAPSTMSAPAEPDRVPRPAGRSR